jgi:hypothetical protein
MSEFYSLVLGADSNSELGKEDFTLRAACAANPFPSRGSTGGLLRKQCGTQAHLVILKVLDAALRRHLASQER